ncbi:Hypothetical predicted protein [Pelobates cultripes]|uniref:Uncharacterized protein n=1 Tax=Pelobates cultripes TaxID=61616 RepID=A0AAD1RFI2_PELCU|nr:Hypothetical predicted protein [Pelobates cultripes]
MAARMTKECDSSHNAGENTEENNCQEDCYNSTLCAKNIEQYNVKRKYTGNEIKSSDINNLHTMEKTKQRSRSMQTDSQSNQITPVPSCSGPNLQKLQLNDEVFTNDFSTAKRLSVSQHSLNNSAWPPFVHTAVLSVAAHRSLNEKTCKIQQTSQASSSSSTLSFLFGKRSFSSALVISGLSAEDGENTIDTLSSSSVNIAMCPAAIFGNQTSQALVDYGERLQLSSDCQRSSWIPRARARDPVDGHGPRWYTTPSTISLVYYQWIPPLRLVPVQDNNVCIERRPFCSQSNIERFVPHTMFTADDSALVQGYSTSPVTREPEAFVEQMCSGKKTKEGPQPGLQLRRTHRKTGVLDRLVFTGR